MYRNVMLGDVVDITSSKRIFYSEYTDKGVPFYRSKEIIEKAGGKDDISTELFISKERFHEIATKFGAPQQGDVLLTSVGTLGIPYLVRKDERFYFKDGNLTWFRNFKPELDRRYLLYWLTSRDGKNELLNHTIGSTQKALTIQGLKKVKIPLPSLEVQNRIADILGTIDEKIELNRKMNETLERMGQVLFSHYFVDNPEAWKWKKRPLGDCVRLVNGVSYKSAELKPSRSALATLKSIERGGGFSRRGYKEFIGKIKESQIVQDGDLVVAHTDLTQKAEVAGYPALIDGSALYDRVAISMDLVKVIPRYSELSSSLVYFLLKTREFQNYKTGYLSGSTVLHLNKKCIVDYGIALPDSPDMLRKISSEFDQLVGHVKANNQQIQTLADIRDALLPRLISGKVKL